MYMQVRTCVVCVYVCMCPSIPLYVYRKIESSNMGFCNLFPLSTSTLTVTVKGLE